jgi:hypothetical protein
MKSILKPKLGLVIGLIATIELFSVFAYYFPTFNHFAFFLLLAIVAIAAWENMAFGVLIVLTELFIGSKGYLFYINFLGGELSWRLALWLVVMIIWGIKAGRRYFQKEKILDTKEKEYLRPFLLLFAFIALGVINGLIHGHTLSNWFFDFNGWIYFALIFPLYEVFAGKKQKENWVSLKTFFMAAVFFLSIKTILVFLVIRYGQGQFAFDIYRWIRTTGVGEVTLTDSGFFRVFFQSHLFVAAAWLINFWMFAKAATKKVKCHHLWPYLLNMILFSTVLIIGLSRSFWLGFGLALLAGLVMIGVQSGKKLLMKSVAFLVISGVIATGLVSLLAWTAPANFLMRADIDRNEPAAASRLVLWQKITNEISDEPVLGKGYGATITYLSSDPRVKGLYTTYAFEWGWLDLWLKIGIFGLLAYLYLLGHTIHQGLSSKYHLGEALGLVLLALAIVNIFSPYVNHPLGIGLLLLSSLAIVSRPEIG